MKLHRRYGDFVRIAPNHISIADPAALQQVYGHKGGFIKGPFYDAFHQVRPVIFTSRDIVAHQRKRKYLNPAFSTRNLKAFEPYMSSDILCFKSCVAHIADGGKSVNCDISQLLNYLAFDVIANYSFGKPFGFLVDQKDEGRLVETIDRRGETVNALGSMNPWLRPFMKYAFFDLFWYKGLRAKANLEKYGREAYSRRRREGTGRQDLLSFLFNAKDPDSGRELDGEEIVAESISFIIGGSDTTSSTMTNFVDIVSRRPDLRSRLQQELDSTYPGPLPADWVADAETTEKLQFLNATLREVMRFRPTSSTGLERICPPGGSSIAGKFIPGGVS
jgi:benzoate 4-monooxygenase